MPKVEIAKRYHITFRPFKGEPLQETVIGPVKGLNFARWELREQYPDAKIASYELLPPDELPIGRKLVRVGDLVRHYYWPAKDQVWSRVVAIEYVTPPPTIKLNKIVKGRPKLMVRIDREGYTHVAPSNIYGAKHQEVVTHD